MLTKEILVELTSKPLHSPDWVFEICLLPLLALLCGDCQNHFLKFQNKSSWNYAKSIIIWFGTFTRLSYRYHCSPLPTVLWILFTLQMSNIVFFPPSGNSKNQKEGARKRECEGNAVRRSSMFCRAGAAGRGRRRPCRALSAGVCPETLGEGPCQWVCSLGIRSGRTMSWS